MATQTPTCPKHAVAKMPNGTCYYCNMEGMPDSVRAFSPKKVLAQPPQAQRSQLRPPGTVRRIA